VRTNPHDVSGIYETNIFSRTFSVICEDNLQCSISRFVRSTGQEETVSKTYVTGSSTLFSWIREVIELSFAGR